MARSERVSEHLNRALHMLFRKEEKLYLLGEDILDPYGGAFKVTAGLADEFPARVLSTPISENAIVGVANGLALAGNKVIVEIMFGDFLGLAFDQLVNFAAKSVAMYGSRTSMPVVVRCPVGGGRGYGATHSQSPQKHFIGVPHLALYELSQFHDASAMLLEMLDRGEPAILFEPKELYGERSFPGGRLNDRFDCTPLGGPTGWAHLHAGGTDAPRAVLVASGGTATRAIEAATQLIDEDGLDVDIMVPARLYPLDPAPLLPMIKGAVGVWVLEEGTAGGTWGAEVADRVHQVAWADLRRPVTSLHSADEIIPAAPHLERTVLLQAEAVRDAIRSTLSVQVGSARPSSPHPDRAPAGVTVPALNSNDREYVLLDWFVDDGAAVTATTPVAEIETSKTVEEIAAGGPGFLRRLVEAGGTCVPGQVIAELLPDSRSSPVNTAPGPSTAPAPAPPGRTDVGEVPRHQRQVAEMVTASHRDIPPAFAVTRVDVGAVLRGLDEYREREGEEIGLTEVLIGAVAALRPRFPMLFAHLDEDFRTRIAEGAHVAVTVDAGNGLYLPVIRNADAMTLADVADRLVTVQLAALRSDMRASDLEGANIAVSVSQEAGIRLVQPIIPSGLACVISLPAAHPELYLGPDGAPRERVVVDLGLVYDHRIVNGLAANAFLTSLRADLESRPGRMGATGAR